MSTQFDKFRPAELRFSPCVDKCLHSGHRPHERGPAQRQCRRRGAALRNPGPCGRLGAAFACGAPVTFAGALLALAGPVGSG
jgi:hypothetical protein